METILKHSLWITSLLAVLVAGNGRLAVAQHQPAGPALLPYLSSLVVDERTDHAFAIAYSYQPDSIAQVAMFNASTGALLHITPLSLHGVYTLAVDEVTSRLFVAQGDTQGRARVAVLDTHDAALLRAVPVGQEPDAIVVDARAGRVFVMNGVDSTITVLDARTGAVQRTMPSGTGPIVLAVDERNGYVFSAGIMSRLTMLDGASGKVMRIVAIPLEPSAIGVDEQAGRVFLASFGAIAPRGATASPGIVTVIDANTGRILNAVRVGYGPRALVVDEQTSRAFVLNVTVGYVAGAYPRLPGPIASSISVLDTHMGTVLRTITLRGISTELALDQAHGRVFALNLGTVIPPKTCMQGCSWHDVGNSSIVVVDARTGSILRSIPVGGELGAMAVDDLHNRLLITRSDHHVLVLDTSHL